MFLFCLTASRLIAANLGSENIAAGNAPRLSIKLSAHAADLIARLIAFDPANRIGCGAATDDSASALVRTKSGSADSGNESSNSSAGTNINGGTHTGSGSDNGSGRDADAIAAVFAHPFFADIDWDRMRDGELPSPYIAYLQQQQQADGANGVGGDAAVAAIYPALRADEVPKFASAMDVLVRSQRGQCRDYDSSDSFLSLHPLFKSCG